MTIPIKATLALVPGIALLGVAYVGKPHPANSPAESKSAVPINVNYAEHVAPILNKNCVKCHRDGESAPFSLDSYAQAKKYSDMIALATSKRRMPPWKAHPGDYQFRDDAHLDQTTIETLGAWAKAGAPRGDQSKEPKPPKFQSGWANGKPDLILKMPYEHELGAEGDDEYWNFVISPNIKEPTWISGMDVKPGNPNIVHHVIAFLDKKGRGTQLAKSQKGDGKFGYTSSGGGVGFLPDGALGGWAPGAHGHLLPSDAGFLLEPGTDIILQVHYNKSGKVEKDQTEMALYFNRDVPKNEVQLAFIANPFIQIQPGKAGQMFNWTMTLPKTVRSNRTVNLSIPRAGASSGGNEVNYRLYNLMPHMHLLGRSMKATATLPDGTKKVLIDLRDWDFNWQLVYTPVTPIDLPGGTKISITAEYDNSTDNPFQPSDPPKLVTWGEETNDEMMLLVTAFSIIPAND
jgi:hypothetical protein